MFVIYCLVQVARQVVVNLDADQPVRYLTAPTIEPVVVDEEDNLGVYVMRVVCYREEGGVVS